MAEQYITTLDEVKERITDILARNEMIRAESQFDISGKVEWLEKTFPGIKINVVNNTYTDTARTPPVTRKLSSMQSTKYNKALKTMPKNEQAKVANAISTIINKRRDAIQKLSDEYVESVASRMFTALSLRNKNIASPPAAHLRAAMDVMDSICGVHDIENSPLHFRISVDPYDIFMKSTGQYWEYTSCEKISGQYSEGPFHDIVLYNAVCFVEDVTGKAYARIMIRWCLVSKKVDIGIESKWYAFPRDRIVVVNLKDNNESIRPIAPNLTGFDAYKILHGILQSKGLLQYSKKTKSCTTPYSYKGFSDKMRSGDVRIEYFDYENALTGAQDDVFSELIKHPYDDNIIHAIESGIFTTDRLKVLIRLIKMFHNAMLALKIAIRSINVGFVVEIFMKFARADIRADLLIEGLPIFADLVHEYPSIRATFLSNFPSKISNPLHYIAMVLDTYNPYITRISSISAAVAIIPKIFNWDDGARGMIKVVHQVMHAFGSSRVEDLHWRNERLVHVKIATVSMMLVTVELEKIFGNQNTYKSTGVQAYETIRSCAYVIKKSTKDELYSKSTPLLAVMIEEIFDLFIRMNAWASPLLMLLETSRTGLWMPDLALALAKKLPDSYKARDAMMTGVIEKIKKTPLRADLCDKCQKGEGEHDALRTFHMHAPEIGKPHIVMIKLCSSCADILGFVYDEKRDRFTRDADLITRAYSTLFISEINPDYTKASVISPIIKQILESIHFTYNTVAD